MYEREKERKGEKGRERERKGGRKKERRRKVINQVRSNNACAIQLIFSSPSRLWGDL
jgi:hypothetical protein